MHDGHALGLDHLGENCTVDAVMTPSYVGYPFRYSGRTTPTASAVPGTKAG